MTASQKWKQPTSSPLTTPSISTVDGYRRSVPARAKRSLARMRRTYPPQPPSVGNVAVECLVCSMPAAVEVRKPEDLQCESTRPLHPWLRLAAECVAELLGTAILVLFGCSGIAQFTLSRGKLAGFLSVNFAFGFGAMIAVYVAGPVSGTCIFIEHGSACTS